MRYPVLIFVLPMLLIMGCNSTETPKEDEITEAQNDKEPNRNPQRMHLEILTDDWNEFAQVQAGLTKLKYPNGWEVKIDSTSPFVIINAYPVRQKDMIKLPLNVNAPAGATFVSVIPKGYGTELPLGTSRSLENWEEEVPVNFPLNTKDSRVLLLENGRAWGYYLKPAHPPTAWTEQGFIFAQISIDSFEAKCFDGKTGEERLLSECDPMDGDKFERHGTLHRMSRKIVPGILRSIEL